MCSPQDTPAQQWHSRGVPVALLALGGRGSPAGPPGPGFLADLLLPVLLVGPWRNKTQNVTKQGQQFPDPQAGIPLENPSLAGVSTPNPPPQHPWGTRKRKYIFYTDKASWSSEGWIRWWEQHKMSCLAVTVPKTQQGPGSWGSHSHPQLGEEHLSNRGSSWRHHSPGNWYLASSGSQISFGSTRTSAALQEQQQWRLH